MCFGAGHDHDFTEKIISEILFSNNKAKIYSLLKKGFVEISLK